MFLIDTNIHVAYLLKTYENDEVTAKYLAFYNSIPLAQRIVPDFIINELETFMMKVAPYKYRVEPEQRQNLKQAVMVYISEILEFFILSTMPIGAYEKAFDIYRLNAGNKYISFTDSLLIALAQNHGFTIFTKDKKIQTVASEMGVAFYNPEI